MAEHTHDLVCAPGSEVYCAGCDLQMDGDDLAYYAARGLKADDKDDVIDDLLAACEQIIADYERLGVWPFSGDALDDLRTALAKAKGE